MTDKNLWSESTTSPTRIRNLEAHCSGANQQQRISDICKCNHCSNRDAELGVHLSLLTVPRRVPLAEYRSRHRSIGGAIMMWRQSHRLRLFWLLWLPAACFGQTTGGGSRMESNPLNVY